MSIHELHALPAPQRRRDIGHAVADDFFVAPFLPRLGDLAAIQIALWRGHAKYGAQRVETDATLAALVPHQHRVVDAVVPRAGVAGPPDRHRDTVDDRALENEAQIKAGDTINLSFGVGEAEAVVSKTS